MALNPSARARVFSGLGLAPCPLSRRQAINNGCNRNCASCHPPQKFRFVCLFWKRSEAEKGLVAGWRAWVSGCFTTCPLAKGLPRKCRALAFGCNRRAVDCASARTLRFVDKLSYKYSCRCTDGPCRSLLELPCTCSLIRNQDRKRWDSTRKFWKSRIAEC